MFPTLDTIINRLLGTHIVYSFPTYNAIFYIAIFMAFLWGYFTIRIQESRGSFPPIYGKEKNQEPITWAHYLSRLIPAFVFGYFLIGVLIHYEEFIDNSQEWIRSLKEIEQMDIDYVISAHGPETQPAIDLASAVKDQRVYLEDLMTAVKKAMDSGTHSPDALRKTVKLPKYENWQYYKEWLPMNIERIWAYYHMGW